MNLQWQRGERTQQSWEEAELEQRTSRIPLKERLDPVILMGASLAVLLLFAALSGLYLFGHRLGLMDQDLLSPLPDERILANIHEDVLDSPLLDAAQHKGDTWIVQKGGRLSRFRPQTGLWSTETPFAAENLTLTRLRSDERDTDPTGTLWALTNNGGLARRSEEVWRLLFTDTAFLDEEGIGFGIPAISGAAVSDDGRWLMLGTKFDGVGLYHIAERRWVDQRFGDYGLPDGTFVPHLVFWRGRFWIGGPDGLFHMDPNTGDYGKEPIDHAIIDLDADPNGGLWVLARKKTADCMDCTWFARYEQPDQPPTILMDERRVFPNLDLADLQFAFQRGDRLVLAGTAGFYTYNTRLHHWSQRYDKEVSAAHLGTNGTSIYFAGPGVMGVLDGEDTTTWALENENVVQMTNAPSGKTLALTESGNVYSLSQMEAPIPALASAGVGIDRRYTNGVAIGEHVLLVGQEGGLLHNVRDRTYRDLPQSILPTWLHRADTQMIHSGPMLYMVTPEHGRLALYSWPVQGLGNLNIAGFIEPHVLPEARTRPKDWHGQGIYYVTNEGQAVAFDPVTRIDLTGPSRKDLSDLTFIDAAAWNSEIAFAADKGLAIYDLKSRAWSPLVVPANPEERIVELNAQGGYLLQRTAAGQLLAATDQEALRRARPLIGGTTGFPFEQSQISDGYFQDERIYLAGMGQVALYDCNARRVTQTWQVDSNKQAPIQISGSVGTAPLAFGGGRAIVGSLVLDEEAGKVESMGMNERLIWTLRNNGQNRYLKGYDLAQPKDPLLQRCFFKNPAPGKDVTRFSDVRVLPQGDLAVATNAGLFFYSPTQHSWFRGPTDIMSRGGRLHLLPKHLVLEETARSGGRVALVPLEKIKLPGACESTQVSFPLAPFPVRRLAVNEELGEVSWLTDDGQVITWKGGKQEVILEASGEAPSSRSLKRVFRRDDFLIFTSSQGLWSYNQKKRSWLRHALAYDSANSKIDNLNLGSGKAGLQITSRTESGDLYLGKLDPNGTDVAMKKLYEKPTAFFAAQGKDLLDVQGHANTSWAFVLKDRIKFYDPRARRWSSEQLLPRDSRGEVTYVQGAGLDVISLDQGKRWLVAQDYNITKTDLVVPGRFADYQLKPGERTAIDSNRGIWRLQKNGTLLRGEAQTNGYGNFALEAGPAVTLIPDTVRAAYHWAPLLVLDQGDALKVLHEDSDKKYPLQDQARKHGGITYARVFEKQLWLLNPKGLLRLERGARDTLRSWFIENIDELAFDHSGTPWARKAGRWLIWDGQTFQTPWIGDGKKGVPAPAKIFMVEGAQPTALDDKRVPYYWNRGFIADDSPLDEALGKNVEMLFRGLDNDWWLLKTINLINVTPGYCISDTAGNLKPCLKESDRLILPNEFPLSRWAHAGVGADGVLQITRDDWERVEVLETNDDRFKLQRGQVQPRTITLEDTWPRLRNYAVPNPDGEVYFNPITDLRSNESGMLVVVRPSGERVVASRGDIKLQQPAPLNVQWLQWDRAKNAFQVTTSTGKRRYGAAQFVVEGRLLFEELDDLLSDDSGLHAVNAFGIWHFPNQHLGLDETELRFDPKTIAVPVEAVHDSFKTARGRFDVSGQAVRDKNHRVDLHDATFTETGQGISGKMTVGDREVDSFANRGFAWDGDRLGLIYEGNNLLLRSKAGFHPVDKLASFDPGPPLGDPIGRAYSTGDGSLYLQTGNRWYARHEGVWSETDNPLENRTLVSNSRWTWSLEGGELQVKGKGKAFDLLTTPQGPAFAGDLIQAAAFPEGKPAVMTAAFLEIADDADQLARGVGRRFPPQPTDALSTLTSPGSGTRLVRKFAGETTIWDSGGNTFITPPRDPVKNRPLIDHDMIRMGFVDGTAHLSVRMIDLNGDIRWMPQDLIRGHFPFDRVTAIGVQQNQVFVGTPVGLQVYSRSMDMSLKKMMVHQDLRAPGQVEPAAVIRMGITPDQPGVLMIDSRGVDLEVAGDRTLKPSDAPERMTDRLRVKSDLWRWVKAGDGTLTGNYDDGSETWASTNIRLLDGRLPHDRLVDIAFWRGQAFSLWDNGWVSVSSNPSLVLDSGLSSQSLAHLKPRRFVQIPVVGAPHKAHLKHGLYLESRDASFFHYQDRRWNAVTNPIALAALKDYVVKPPLYQSSRLRLQQGVSLRFEQCTQNGIWRPLRWRNGRVGIDRIYALMTVGDTIWAGTPEGVVSFIEKDGYLNIDPHRVTVIRELTKEQTDGRITDLMMENGKTVARLDQDSEKLYTGTLDVGKDTAVFEKHKGRDPFAERLFIPYEATGYWEWRVMGRNMGRRGYLQANRTGERVQLAAGRFDFDTINSIALYKEGFLDLCTDLGGWFREKIGQHHVADLTRVTRTDIEPINIREVLSGRDKSGPVLGLKTLEGNYIRLAAGSAPQEVRDFRVFQGEDHLWRYEKDKQGLIIEARDDVGGAGRRTLIEGRFNDDVVLGFPINHKGGYLVPTYAGVLEIDGTNKPKTVHTPPYPGLGDKGVPTVLFYREGKVLYAGETAFYHLFEDRAEVTGLGIAAPTNYQLESMVALNHGAWRAYWRDGDVRGFTRLRGEDLATYPAMMLHVDLSNLGTFVKHQLEWGNPTPWLLMHFQENTIVVQSQDGEARTRIELPDQFKLVKPMRVKDQLYLLGEHKLLTLNLDRMVRQVYAP